MPLIAGVRLVLSLSGSGQLHLEPVRRLRDLGRRRRRVLTVGGSVVGRPCMSSLYKFYKICKVIVSWITTTRVVVH